MDQLAPDAPRLGRLWARLLVVVLCGAGVFFGLTNLSFASAATNWLTSLAAGSKGEAQARPAITTATGNPVTFTAACQSSSSEVAVLTWTTAGSGVTGYEVWVSSTVNGTFALDATQPVGTALTVNETYTSGTGNKFYRLEAESAHWAFPGPTITNARQAAVSGTNGGHLTISSSGTECTAVA
jgi:hypothetical protein